MVKSKGLGRGLDALLAGDLDSVSGSDMLRTLKVKQLQPGKYQPRTQMDQESLAQLADSIRAQGIMQPILVRAVAPEKFEIIAGERRWRWCTTLFPPRTSATMAARRSSWAWPCCPTGRSTC